MSRNDGQTPVETPTPSPETTDMVPTGGSSSTAGFIAGIVILLVVIVVETALCGIVWLVCLQKGLNGGIKCGNGTNGESHVESKHYYTFSIPFSVYLYFSAYKCIHAFEVK